MTKEEYQEFVKEGASSAYNAESAMIAMVEEVGEVCGLIKKKLIYPNYDFKTKKGYTFEEGVLDEMGDVLWQYLNLCNYLGLDINDIINHNLEKLNDRHGGAKTALDGGKR